MIPKLLIITGLGDSGEKHWQSHWLKNFKNATKVHQDNYEAPQLANWLKTLHETIEKLNEPTILVAHSLGVSLVLHWAAQNTNPNIIGALLVAPADVNSVVRTPQEIRNFAPMPMLKLPFPSILVVSEDDTYVSLPRAQYFADNWESKMINIGNKGHINSASNLGHWEEGQLIIRELMHKKDTTASM
jgi:uncharacterized protein